MISMTIDFDKRFEEKMPDVATYPGIYAVWAYNGDTKNPQWVLLDIGQAKNMANRHSTHERKQQWQEFAEQHKMGLVFYTTEMTNDHNYRDIAEAALLYKFQPLCPTDGKDGYHHEDVKISVIGHLKNVFGEFIVLNTDK